MVVRRSCYDFGWHIRYETISDFGCWLDELCASFRGSLQERQARDRRMFYRAWKDLTLQRDVVDKNLGYWNSSHA